MHGIDGSLTTRMTVASGKKHLEDGKTHTHARVVLFWQLLMPSNVNQICLGGERDVLDHAIYEATGRIIRFKVSSQAI